MIKLENTDCFALIYTDGGMKKKGQFVQHDDIAAWAYLIETLDMNIYSSGKLYGVDNNTAELMGLIKSLDKLLEYHYEKEKLLFVLDSKYVVDKLVDNRSKLLLLHENDWKKANQQKLPHLDEWKILYYKLKFFDNSSFRWIRGHSGYKGNEFVDKLVKREMNDKWKLK